MTDEKLKRVRKLMPEARASITGTFHGLGEKLPVAIPVTDFRG